MRYQAAPHPVTERLHTKADSRRVGDPGPNPLTGSADCAPTRRLLYTGYLRRPLPVGGEVLAAHTRLSATRLPLMVVERAGNGADDPKSEALVLHGPVVGLRHRVELHSGITGLPRPGQRVPAQRLTDAASARVAGDHEAGGGDMRARSRPVGLPVRGADNRTRMPITLPSRYRRALVISMPAHPTDQGFLSQASPVKGIIR
jgi:hypothetical protein